MVHEQVDLSIVGAGPTGLFALFYSGMRGVSARLIDALPEPGGQLTALYPEKYIFDVAGFPKVLAKDLVRDLTRQACQFGAPVHLNQQVVDLEQADGGFVLATATDRFPSRAILVAGGLGAFTPRRLPQAAAAPWYGRGIHETVTDPEAFRGRRIVIIGGGDSAFDWAHQLLDRAASVTLMHRSDRFRAHQATVDEIRRAAAAGRLELLTFHELHDVVPRDGLLRGILVRDARSKETRRIDCDAVLPMLGYVSDLGALAHWGFTLEKDEIVVDSRMGTGRAGVWAAGDIVTYPGKLKLIATGFGEAATAVNQAVHWMYPEKKVNPGHSSNMALFGQQED